MPSGKMRTWIIGDSIVYWANRNASYSPPCSTLTWCGLRGARLEALIPTLRRQLRSRPVPHMLIIHLGTNDLFSIPVKEIRERIEEGLRAARNLLPGTTIIWSDILPRLFYFGEIKRNAGRRNVRALNRFAQRICTGLGNAHRIVHTSNFMASQHAMFRCDGVHLSPLGNEIFCGNLYSAIEYFAANPLSLLYPPSLQS